MDGVEIGEPLGLHKEANGKGVAALFVSDYEPERIETEFQ